MDSKQLYGIVPALITPLNEDLSLDIDSLAKLIEYQIDAGVHGIFVAGMTGEGAALGTAQLKELIRYSARFIAGRVPLCAGVLEAGTRRTLETALAIADAGADILSTTVPYAPPAPTQSDIAEHFAFLCRHIDLPWMVYGNSGSLTNIAPDTFHTLACLEGVCAIKDTRPDFEGHMKNIIAVRTTKATLLTGGEYLVGPGLLWGSDGNISGATNLFPKLFCDLYAAAKTGNVACVQEMSEKVAVLHSMTSCLGVCWLSIFKYAGSRMGLMKPYCLLPSQPLDTAHMRIVDQTLEQFM